MRYPLHAQGAGRRQRLLAAVALAAVAALTAAVAPAGPAGPAVAASLQSADRLEAPLLLARPSGGGVQTGRNMTWGTSEAAESPLCHPLRPLCVHWTDAGAHAAPDADADGDGVPDQAEETLAAVATSWVRIVGQLGFRAPLPDGRSSVNGGDNRFDIYLANTGKAGLVGYTSSDDPRLARGSGYAFRDGSAFIVLDNDFRQAQFPSASPAEHLKVAAAHEFFHAVQFAYDHREDTWMTEGTAAWAEDQVFTGINLNRDFLQHSPLSAPGTPLDFGRQGHQYGSWIFFQYLSERFGARFIATIWRLADDSPAQVSRVDTQTYSMRSIRRAISRQDRDFRSVLVGFVRANLKPSTGYREGGGYLDPFTPRLPLGSRGEDTGWLGTPIDHLAAAYVSFVPADNAPAGRRLQIRVDGPLRGTSPAATVVVRFDSGRSKDVSVRLNKLGNGQVRVPFGRETVSSVDVAMINASARYAGCLQRSTSYACRGVPKDDDRSFKVRAKVL